jgi:hypothetical protein
MMTRNPNPTPTVKLSPALVVVGPGVEVVLEPPPVLPPVLVGKVRLPEVTVVPLLMPWVVVE